MIDDERSSVSRPLSEWDTHLPHLWHGFQVYAERGTAPVATAEWRPPPLRGRGGLHAWWSPLLHATIYGMGTSAPISLLAQMLDDPDHLAVDPRAQLIRDWWGEALDAFVAWGYATHVDDRVQQLLLYSGDSDREYGRTSQYTDEQLEAIAAARGLSFDGGYDRLHLVPHALSWTVGEPAREIPRISEGGDGASVHLTCASFTAWPVALRTEPTLQGKLVDVTIDGYGDIGRFVVPANPLEHLPHLLCESTVQVAQSVGIGSLGSSVVAAGGTPMTFDPSLEASLSPSASRDIAADDVGVGPALARAIDACSARMMGDPYWAFLALTGKVELQVRDLLAWQLQVDYCNSHGLVAAREYQRCDLAVLDGAVPVALLEAKALYVFDLVTPATLKEYVGALKADADKARSLAHQLGHPQARLALLVLTTHFGGEVGSDQLRWVKYGKAHNQVLRRIEKQGSVSPTEFMAAEGTDRLRAVLDSSGWDKHDTVLAHSTFDGINVTINAHLRVSPSAVEPMA